MEKQHLIDFADWLWDMDRLKVTTQLPPFENSGMMVELYLKAKMLNDKCEGKLDSTSGKDLRVCEVIASASTIVEKGVNAMYDELIDKHINVLRQDPFRSSVQYFIEKGTVSGSFLLALRGLLKEHDEICQAAK